TLRTYELIREGMTRKFLRNLCDRPGFGRLYFCSPWIHLGAKDEELLKHAVLRAQRRARPGPEILVITRPDETVPSRVPSTLQSLVTLGATVYLHARLHTKLYIREPDANG